jgi:hypothetical protein
MIQAPHGAPPTRRYLRGKTMLKLTIETGNAAFEDLPGHECARILRDVAAALERGTRAAPLHDLNGNRVGRFDLTP